MLQVTKWLSRFAVALSSFLIFVGIIVIGFFIIGFFGRVDFSIVEGEKPPKPCLVAVVSNWFG